MPRFLTHFLGGLTVRQRIAAFGGVGVAALLGFFSLWGVIDTKSLSAMEQVAQNVRRANSYKCTLLVRITRESPQPQVPTVSEFKHILYRIASGESRIEDLDSPYSKEPGTECVLIKPVGKPAIAIDHQDKTFIRLSGHDADTGWGHYDDLERLGKLSGKADRELGTKEIDGKKVRGFEIDMKKIGDDAGLAEIWIDTQTNLPVLVRYEFAKERGRSFSDLITDIQWNVQLDPKLFDTTPPEGYRDATPKESN